MLLRRFSDTSSIGSTPVPTSTNDRAESQRDENVFMPPHRMKILSLGSSNVGKSCAIKRFCEGKFVSKYISTIGIDYGVRPIYLKHPKSGRKERVHINFWDISGAPEFKEIRNEFYKDTQGAFIVYDVTSRASFEALDTWIWEAREYGADVGTLPCVLCANKVDKMRTVTEAEGRQFASRYNWKYFEVSACTGVNIEDAFTTLFNQTFEHVAL